MPLTFDEFLPGNNRTSFTATPPAGQPDASATSGGMQFNEFPTAGYTSTVLPLTYDAQGRRNPVDWSVGWPGLLGRVGSLAEEVLSGKLPAIGPDAKVNPELIRRSNEFASTVLSPNPAVVAGERAIPGLLMGGQSRPLVPTASELIKSGGTGMDAARATGLTVNPTSLGQAASGIRQEVVGKRWLPESAPQAYAQLDAMEGIGGTNLGGLAPGDIGVLQETRRRLRELAMGPNPQESGAASLIIQRLDDLLPSLTPEHTIGGTATGAEAAEILRKARGDYAAGERSKDLSGVGDRANTGIVERVEARNPSNPGNMIRTRVASFLEKPSNLAGYSDAEIAALNDVARGGPVQQLLQFGSTFLNRPGMQAVGAGVGALADPGGLAGPTIGATVPAMGAGILRMIENALAKRSLNAVDEAVRMRSPLYEQRMAAPQAITPQYRATMETVRGLLPMLMAPPPPGVRRWSPADQGFI